jgi:hypothetical protein
MIANNSSDQCQLILSGEVYAFTPVTHRKRT